jgi:hypothetical protein
MAFKYYAFHCYACQHYVYGLSYAQANGGRLTCPNCHRSDDYETFWVCTCGNHVDRHERCGCGSTEPSSSSSGGGCFLTTVVCSVLGYDDNCAALGNLRKFRSDVLEKTNDGHGLLREYKKVSDLIAPKILSDDNKVTLCDYVYSDYIMPVNILVNEHRNEDAIEKYKEMVTYFMKRYEINKSEQAEMRL